MPIVRISIAAGRRPDQIRELIRGTTITVAETLDAPVDSVKVIVTEVELTHWGSGAQTLAEQRGLSPAS